MCRLPELPPAVKILNWPSWYILENKPSSKAMCWILEKGIMVVEMAMIPLLYKISFSLRA
ncbi:hypothetical protein D3C87_2121760 [compost metagenome]